MNEWGTLGRVLLVTGVALAVIGAWLAWGPRVPWLGRLPGDLRFEGPHGKIFVPLGTCLLLSIVLTLLLRWLTRR